MNFSTRCFSRARHRGQRQGRGRGREEGSSLHVISLPVCCCSLPWLAGDGGAGVSTLSILAPGRASPMKSLSEAAVRQYHELGYYAPVPVLTRTEAGTLRRQLEAFEAIRRIDARAGAPQAASAVHLAERPDPPSAHPRCGRGRHRPGHPVLGHDLLHQGSAQPGLCVVASGLDLLGAGAAGHHHRLGRVHRQQRSEWRDAGDPRHAQDGSGATSRHVRRRQPAVARAGDRGRGGRARGGDAGTRGRRDVAASCAADPRLGSQSIG